MLSKKVSYTDMYHSSLTTWLRTQFIAAANHAPKCAPATNHNHHSKTIRRHSDYKIYSIGFTIAAGPIRVIWKWLGPETSKPKLLAENTMGGNAHYPSRAPPSSLQ